MSDPTVVVLGANGIMGAGASGVFAAGGYHVTMLARDLDKARAGLQAAQSAARAEALADRVQLGTYDDDLARAVRRTDYIFEALGEDLALKCNFFEQVDRFRRADSIVATVSSGLSINEMVRGRSDSFRRNFVGIHLYNPPHVITGTEVIPHDETDGSVVERVVAMLRKRLGRKVIVTRDRPAFVGNRVGFKVMNQVAALAARHGVAFMDYLIGPHTGRAMPPLKTVDLVGWDVHKAIVDNIYANCEDEGHPCFQLPAYMDSGIAEGRLGDKTPEQGGFYRKHGSEIEVLDPATGKYQLLEPPKPIEFVEQMKRRNRVGDYRGAMAAFVNASGPEADLARQVVLGYVGYGLGRVGEVAQTAADVDTIMSFGFNWAPPCAIVDLIGARKTAELLRTYELPVPPIVEQAAASSNGARLFQGGVLDYGRTLVG